MHIQDVIHRDLKPANIILKSKEDLATCKICDLGLATKITAELDSMETGGGGTLFYQAPE